MADLTNLKFIVLTGEQFDELVTRDPDAELAEFYGLASPKLKYYMHRSCLVRSPDQRVFLMCVSPTNPGGYSDEDGAKLFPVGIIELEVSPYNDREMWFKYLTVHPSLSRQGIAKELLNMMVAYMQAHPRLLQRSSASEEGEQKIQAYIDQLLVGTGITWRQTGR